MSHLFCFGMGYSAKAIAARLAGKGWHVSGTSRSATGVAAIEAKGYTGLQSDGATRSDDVAAALHGASHVLLSAAPGADGDPVLRHYTSDLLAHPGLQWIAYLSTVGVYGDHQGAWVDETAALRPSSERGRRRVAAERTWMDLGASLGCGVHIFRLSGIYGPGRSPVEKLRNGTAKRIVKPGQVFNRVHVEDIAGAIAASIAKPRASAAGSAIYNITDDEPAPPQDVVQFAAALLGIDPPPEIPFAEAQMSAMARSFYGENKRVSNQRLKDDLGYDLRFPAFRQGLRDIVENTA